MLVGEIYHVLWQIELAFANHIVLNDVNRDWVSLGRAAIFSENERRSAEIPVSQQLPDLADFVGIVGNSAENLGCFKQLASLHMAALSTDLELEPCCPEVRQYCCQA